MKDLSNFFPKTVYFCDCLRKTIQICEKGSSLQHFCNQINKNDTGDNIIYCAKCNTERQDVVFSCTGHMSMGTFTIQYVADSSIVMQIQDRHFCLLCIKKYLREKYLQFNFQDNT